MAEFIISQENDKCIISHLEPKARCGEVPQLLGGDLFPLNSPSSHQPAAALTSAANY